MADPQYAAGEPERRDYSLQWEFREEDPILLDRDRLERRMTDELRIRMAEDGVELAADYRLPGFTLHRHGGFVPPGHVVARIECQVAILPPLPWKPDAHCPHADHKAPEPIDGPTSCPCGRVTRHAAPTKETDHV